MGNVGWFSVAIFSSLKMASTSSGESTGNAESTPTGDDFNGISVMVALLSLLLRSVGKEKSSVSKSARHRSGNVQAIVVWKSDRQKKERKLKNCVGKLKSIEKWWKWVKKSVMWVVKCWRDTTWETRCHWLMPGIPWNGLDAGTVIDGDGVSTKNRWGFDLERIRHYWCRQHPKIVGDWIWGRFVTFDGVSTLK